MSKKTLKLTLAGALVACGLGGFAAGLAWATPGRGITSTNLVGPTVFDAIDTAAETDDWEIELKTRGLSDVYMTHIKVAPGGYSGWHSHPGPSIIAVKAGTATFYDDCDGAETPHHYPAGTGFVEDAGCVHILVNEGTVDLEVVVTQIVPKGAPRRIEADDPRH